MAQKKKQTPYNNAYLRAAVATQQPVHIPEQTDYAEQIAGTPYNNPYQRYLQAAPVNQRSEVSPAIPRTIPQKEYTYKQSNRNREIPAGAQYNMAVHNYGKAMSKPVDDLVNWSKSVRRADASTIKDLSAQAQTFQDYFTQNRDSYDERTLSMARQLLTNGRNALQRASQNPLNYDTQNMNGAEYANYVTQLQRERGRLQRDVSTIHDLNEARSMGDTQAVENYNQYESVQKRLADLKAQNKELKRQNKIRSYNTLMENPDFGENSQYVSTVKRKGSGDLDVAFDHTYEAVNRNYDLLTKTDQAAITQQAAATGGAFDDTLLVHVEYHMTDEERSIFNYLYKTQGKQKAHEYLEALRPDLNKRNAEADSEAFAQLADESWVTATAIRTLSKPYVSMRSFLGQTGMVLTGQEIDPNDPAWMPSRMNKELEANVANNIAQKIGGTKGELASDAYQLGLSIVDNAYAILLGGGRAAGPEAEQFVLGMMGMDATQSGIIDKLQQGYDQDRAIILGVAQGAFEVITERIGLDNFFNGVWKGGPNFIRSLGTQMEAEGAEEGFATLLNWAADFLYDEMSWQDESEWKRKIREYIAQGMSEEDANKQVFADMFKELGIDVVGGAISGGVMGTSAGISENFALSELGKEVKESLPENSQYRRMTDRNLGRFVRDMSVAQEETEAEASEILEQAATEMTEDNYVTTATADAILHNEAAVQELEFQTGEIISSIADVNRAVQSTSEAPSAAQVQSTGEIAPRTETSMPESRNVAERESVASTAARIPAPLAPMRTTQSIPSGVSDAMLNTNKTETQRNSDQELISKIAKNMEESGNILNGDALKFYYNDNYDAAKYVDAVLKIQEAATLNKPEIPETGLPEKAVKDIYEYATQNAEERRAEHEAGETAVRLPGDAGRILSENTGGQGGVLGEGAAEAQGRGTAGESTRVVGNHTFRISAKAVTAKSIGIEKGTDETRVNEVTGGLSKGMEKMRSIAAKRGMDLHYFVGDNLSTIEGKRSTRGVIFTDKNGRKQIWVRADHPMFSGIQIALHEMYHDGIDREARRLAQSHMDNYDNIRKMVVASRFRQLESQFDKKTVDFMLTKYMEFYEGVFDDMPLGEARLMIKEELLCDIAGGMNLFNQIPGLSDLASLQIGIQSVLDVRTTEFQNLLENEKTGESANETRGSPQQLFESRDGGIIKYSSETEESKRLRQQLKEAETMLNEMTVIASVSTEDVPDADKGNTATILSKKVNKTVDRKGYGIIETGLKQIKKTFNYQFTKEEFAPLLAVERVLKRGEVIDSHPEHKGRRKLDSITFAGPITIDGVRHNMGVAVQTDMYDTHRLKTYRIVLPTGTVVEILDKKREATDVRKPSSDEDGGNTITSPSGETVPQSPEKDNTKFSMHQSVETVGNLVAVHNIFASDIEKALDLGGFPMPSIAVTKAEMGHSMFGDVTLVFGKNTIDPKSSVYNKVYSGDAWTPTFPTVDLQMDDAMAMKIYSRANKVERGTPFFNPVDLYPDNINRNLQHEGSEEALIESFKNDYGMKQMYLSESGKGVVPYVTKERAGSQLSDEDISLAEYVVDNIDAKTLEDVPLGDGNLLHFNREHRGELSNIYDSYLKNGNSNETIDKLYQSEKEPNKNIAIFKISSILQRYLNGDSAPKIENDRKATKAKIDRKVDKKGFTEWLNKMFTGIHTSSGFRNDVDPFTPSGNRRKWSALHMEVTLENAVKVMRGQEMQKGAGFLNIGSPLAASTKDFSSIDEIRSRSSQLQKLPIEEYEKIRKGFTERFGEIVERFCNNPTKFGAMMDTGTVLCEDIAKSSSKKQLDNKLKNEAKYGYKYSSDLVDDLWDLVEDIQNMPTGYFEAKPRRAVTFDEVEAALVPTGTSRNLVNRMKEAGVQKVVRYQKGSEEDRLAKLNSLDNVRFSRELDSKGNRLSEQQAEFFRDSQARDENGNLAVVYHSSRNGGFTIFDSSKSDDKLSFFFTDNYNMSRSYIRSGTDFDVYKDFTMPDASNVKNLNDLKNYLDGLYDEKDDAISVELFDEEDVYYSDNYSGGEYSLDAYIDKYGENYESVQGAIYDRDGYTIGDFDSLERMVEIFPRVIEEINSEMGGTEGLSEPGTYAVYLNLQEPLIIDANGANWDSIMEAGFKRYYVQKDSGKLFERDEDTYIISGEPASYTIDEIRDIFGDALADLIEESDFDNEYGSHEFFTYNEDAFDPEVEGYPWELNTRGWAAEAYDLDYDGVIFRNLYDNGEYGYGAESGDVYVAFKPEQIKAVNNYTPTDDPDIRYSKELDARYLELAKDPEANREELQRMVDQAARDAGYNVRAYHGTSNYGFTEFKLGVTSGTGQQFFGKGFYFTSDRNVADKRYANPGAYVNDQGEWVEYTPGVYDTYLNLGDDLTLDWKEFVNSGKTRKDLDDLLKQNSDKDSIVVNNIKDGTNIESTVYVIKDSARIKSADPVTYDDDGNVIPLSERFNSENPDIRFSRETSPEFYSQLARQVEAYKGDKIGAASLIPYLKGKGIKDEEIKWTGIATFLEGKKSVAKADLLKYIQDNGLKIEETVLQGSQEQAEELFQELNRLGVSMDDFVDPMDGKFMGSVFEDFLNEYLEEESIDDDTYHKLYDLGIAVDSNETYWSEYALSDGKNYREILYKIPGSEYSNEAMKMHWSSNNKGVVAHARVQDFGDILFVEEIQSDWHNAGQQYGYGELDPDNFDVGERPEFFYLTYKGKPYKQNGKFVTISKENTKSEIAALDMMTSKISMISVPDAPFRNNYTDFVLKDLLRKAAEEGKSYLAWTTGKMQEERWSSEYAEGYRIEYDQDIPKFLKKYGKQWGAKLTEIRLDEHQTNSWDGEFYVGLNPTTVPAIEITDAMRESVLTEGQPMFSRELDPSKVEITLPENIQKQVDALAKLRTEYADLQKENEKNKGRAEYFKGETKLNVYSKNPQIDTKKLERAAKNYIREYGLKMDETERKELIKKLRKYAEDFHLGGKDFHDLSMNVLPLANEIVRSAKMVIESPEQEIVDHIRKEKIKVSPKIRTDISDYGQFRKQYFGRVNLSTLDGTPVEDFYRELQAAYGTSLFPEEIMNPTDQLYAILEMVDSMQPMEVPMYSTFDMAEATQSVAIDIMNDVMAMAPHKTYADKQVEARNRLKKQMQEQARQAIKKVRENRDERIQRLKDHYKEVAERKRIRKEDADIRTKLLKKMRTLDKLAKYADKPTQQRIQELIGDYDLVAKGITGEKVEKLEDLLDYITKMQKIDQNFMVSDKTLNELDRLRKKRVADIDNIEDAIALTKILQNIENEIRTYRKLIDTQYKQDISLLGSQIYDDVIATKGIGNTSSGLMNWFEKVFDKGVATPTIRPETEILRLVGYNRNSPLFQLTYGTENSLASGQRDAVRYQWMANKKYFDKFLEDKEFVRDIMGKKAKEYKITGRKATGEIVTLSVTPDLLMALYMHSQNKQNFQHFGEWVDEKGKTQYGGGITIPDYNLYKKGQLEEAYRIAARDQNKITMTKKSLMSAMEQLTNKERAFINAAQRYYSEMSQPEINKVSNKLLGYDLAQVENYFRIDTDSDYRGANMDVIKMDGSIEGMGFTHERVKGARNPILLISLTDQLRRDIDSHSKYIGLAIPIRNLNKAIGVNRSTVDENGNWTGAEGSVQSAIRGKWGNNASNYIQKLMRDIQNPVRVSESYNKIFSKLRGNYAGSVLALNAGVAIKQAASYPTAAAVVGWKPLIKAFGNSSAVQANRLNMDIVNKYSPLMYLRTQGMGYQELADLKRLGSGALNRALNSKALNWIQDVDVMTIKKLWKASEFYVRDNFKDLEVGSEAYYKKVGEIHSQVIEQTQPNYTTLQRGEILRSDSDLVRMVLGMFKTQPFQNFSILYEAVGELRATSVRYKANPNEETRAAMKLAGKKFSRAISSQIIASLVFALMQGVWDWLRGRDDKYRDKDGNLTFGSAFKQIAINMGANGFGMIPLGGVLYETIETSVDKVVQSQGGEPIFDAMTYGLDAGAATGIINDIQGAVLSLIGNASSIDLDSKTTTEAHLRTYIDVAAKAAQALGYPAENFIKDGQTIALNIFRGMGDSGQMNKYMAEYYSKRIFSAVNSKSKKDYMDLLYRAYDNDSDAYNQLYDIYIGNDGFATSKKTSKEYIDNQIETYAKERQKEQNRVDAGLTQTDLDRYEASLATHDTDGSGTPSKDEIYQTLMEIDMTMKQKEAIWAERGYKKNGQPQSLSDYDAIVKKKK